VQRDKGRGQTTTGRSAPGQYGDFKNNVLQPMATDGMAFGFML
jgi:hypothetical protein